MASHRSERRDVSVRSVVLQRNGFETRLGRAVALRFGCRRGATRGTDVTAATGVSAPGLRAFARIGQWLHRVGAHLGGFVTRKYFEFIANLQVVAIYRANTVHDGHRDLALLLAT